jgi:hypothetical protein
MSTAGAIASGVVFCELLPDESIHKRPVGQYFFREDSAKLLRGLVLDAARHVGQLVPSLATFDRAELFYRDGVLAGTRVSGKYAVGANRGNKIEWRDWSTPEAPKFTFSNERDIGVNPSDAGRAYIAVSNTNTGVLVKWDLSTQYVRGKQTAKDRSRQGYTFLFPEKVNIDPDLLTSLKVPGTTAIINMVRHLEPESLPSLFLPKPPTNSGKLLMVKVSDDHRMLLYLADHARVEYDLARTYALSKTCSQEKLAECAAEGDLTPEQAKVVWVRRGFSEQAVFVREGLEEIGERNDVALRDVFETTLGSTLYQGVLTNWIPRGLWKKEKPVVMMQPILRQELRNLKKAVGTRGRGRRRQTAEEKTELREKHEIEILFAVMKVCEAARTSGADEFDAEDLVTKDTVAKEMRKSVATLYRWLNDSRLDFDRIKSNSLRREYSRK